MVIWDRLCHCKTTTRPLEAFKAVCGSLWYLGCYMHLWCRYYIAMIGTAEIFLNVISKELPFKCFQFQMDWPGLPSTAFTWCRADKAVNVFRLKVQFRCEMLQQQKCSWWEWMLWVWPTSWPAPTFLCHQLLLSSNYFYNSSHFHKWPRANRQSCSSRCKQ